MITKCDNCGFEIVIYSDKIRDKIFNFRSHLIEANLWGCEKCQAFLKKQIKDLENVS